MRAQLIEVPKPQRFIHQVSNVDTSGSQNSNSQINIGTPLVLNCSPTPQPSAYQNGYGVGGYDGLQVILPSSCSGNSAAIGLAYGVALSNIQYNQLGDSMMHGVCQATVVVQTRAASTNVWAATTLNSTNTNCVMFIDIVNNAFAIQSTAGTHGIQPIAVLLDSLTIASSASATSDTRTVITQSMRVFVRMM